MAAVAGGCWAPAAMELAPLGAEALSAVGQGAGDLVAGTTMVAHNGKPDPDDEDGDLADTMRDCNGLQQVTPGIVQFRVTAAGATEWRELTLGGSAKTPRWTILAAKNGDNSGWRPAQNLAKLDFVPPISIAPNRATYLAYAPAESQTSEERSELINLMFDFGPSTGTFRWDGRLYDYSLLSKLPCYPSPPV